MKKTLFLLGLCAFAVCGVVSAAELTMSKDVFVKDTTPTINDFKRVLTEYDSSWGYVNSSDTATCSADGTTSVNVEAPFVYDSLSYEAGEYRLFLSPYRVSSLKNGDSSVDTSKIIVKTVAGTTQGDIKFALSQTDGLDTSKAYYGVIVPIDNYDAIGTPSNEICFIMDQGIFTESEACDTISLVLSPDEPVCGNGIVEDGEDCDTCQADMEANGTLCEEHGAATDGTCTAGMDLANISHTIKGDTITLTWTSMGNCNVSIAIFDPTEEIYKDLGSVPMSDEKFSYKMKWNGEQIFMLTNGQGSERVYKVDAAATPTEEEPEIVTPATGPADNLIAVIIAALVVYGAYVVFFRKADQQ